MGDTRKFCARVMAALVGVSGVSVVGAASPAQAAGGLPTQCVETVYGNGVRLPYNVPLEDIDVRVVLGGRQVTGELVFFDQGSGYRTVLTDQFNRLGDASAVTFDNSASSGYRDEQWGYGEVRVRPKDPLPSTYYSDTYAFSVEAYGTLPPQDVSFTVRWMDCDGDSDAIGDRTRDNCVGVYNPDQTDIDRDGRGDACDPDDDNDGVADVSDNCPTTANSDQTDWDGDRIGNACDTTPGTAPVQVTPTPTPVAPTPVAPTPTTPPPGTATPGCTASCAYASTIGLRRQKSRPRFTGKVESVAVGCRAGVEVTIWRKKSGDDRLLVVVTTRATGKFRTKAPRRAGRYYATVGSPAQPLCGSATSRVVRIRKR